MAVVSLTGATWANAFAAADLNSLANGGQKTSSLGAPQIDNSTVGQVFAQFEVTLAALSPAPGASVIVALIPETQVAGTYVTSTDGTNAATQARWQNCPHDIIQLTQGTTAQVQRSKLIPIVNERYKVVLLNRAGVPLAGSGNQVAYRLVTEAVN